MKGFPPKWCRWIEEMVKGDSVWVKINDDIGHYFKLREDLYKVTVCLLFYSM